MFRSNDETLKIPSKTLLIKPLISQDYSLSGSNTQIQFKLNPESIPFLIANKTFLKMDVKMKGAVSNYRPCASAGAHSLIRNVRITSLGTEVENVQEYNSLVALKYSRNKDSSLDAKRSLFQGQSRTTTNNQSLYLDAPTPIGVTPVAANTDDYKVINVELPIHAGLFQHDKIHCNIAMPLDITFNLESVKRACESISKTGMSLGTVVTAFANTNARTTVEVSKTDILGVFIGDSILLTEGGNTQVVGPIKSMVGDNANPTKLQLTFDSFTPNFAYSTAAVATIDSTSATHRQVGVDVDLTNISLVVTSCQPPVDYVKSVRTAVVSDTGLSLPIRTFELQRVNLTSPSGLQTINIPNQSYDKVLSTFAVPINVPKLQDLEFDGLKGIYDGLNSYQYVHGGMSVPNREVPTDQYALTRPSAIHQNELKKALDNSHIECLDLHRIPDTGFVIGRAWSDRNNVSDLSDEPLSLNLDYASTSTINKIIFNYINNVRVLNVSERGVVRM